MTERNMMDNLTYKAKTSKDVAHIYEVDIDMMFAEDVVQVDVCRECKGEGISRITSFNLCEGAMDKDQFLDMLSELMDEQGMQHMSAQDIMDFLASDSLKADLEAIDAISQASGRMLADINAFKKRISAEAQENMDNA